MVRPQAVVCDLDGTLVDSTTAMAHALRVGCGAVGVHLGPEVDLAWCVGPRIEDSLRALVGADRMVGARSAFRDEYRRSGPALTRPMPGAALALKDMAAAGIALGVATYKPAPLAALVLQATGLFGLFEAVCGRRLDVEDERPKAAILTQALAALGFTPSQAFYVGDHDEDAIAAETVGITFLRYGVLDWPVIGSALAVAADARVARLRTGRDP